MAELKLTKTPIAPTATVKAPVSTSLVAAKRLDVGVKVQPAVSAGVVSLAVSEALTKQAEEAQAKAEKDMEAEFVQSLQDGSYFVGEVEETAPSTAAIVAEVGADEQGGEGDPEVIVISGEPAAAPSREPEPEAQAAPAETAKDKVVKVMDWLTEDQMRLTIILTVFCMVCWMVVKLVKK